MTFFRDGPLRNEGSDEMEMTMTEITERELSARLAALQSVCNLLDWEQQNATLAGKSCDRTGVAEQLKKLRRELIRGSRRKKPEKNAPALERALTAELDKMREMEERFTEEQAQEKEELTCEAGRLWKLCRTVPAEPEQKAAEQDHPAQGNSEPDNPEQQYLGLLGRQTELLRRVLGAEGYEVCLRDYEECYGRQEIDDYLESCKQELKGLIRSRQKKQEQEGPVWEPEEHYTPERQRQLACFLSEYLGFDPAKGQTGEVMHPFTTAVNRDCVCWSNRYLWDNPFPGIFTALHETGHAIYEQNVAEELEGTVLAGGCSSAMHEAVARFYENCIGRREDFWVPVYGKVTEILGGEFERLPFPEFMRRVRWIAPGCVRTMADELTYPYHIILRYELEQALFRGELKPEELPEEWNRKMKEYLGTAPEGSGDGYLQDIHWSAGQFGYFPAYQTGNAIAAQIYRQVKQVLPLQAILREGKLKQLKEYLTTHIFRYGLTRNTDEILQEMTGEPLRFHYYLDYLRERYGDKPEEI